MNRRIFKLMALVLVLALALSGCNLIQRNEDRVAQKPVAQVNGVNITKGEVQPLYDYYKTMYQYYNQMYGSAIYNTDNLPEQIIDSFVEREVIRQKAKDEGIDPETEENKAKITEAAQTAFDEAVDKELADGHIDTEGMTDEEAREAVIAHMADEEGITLENYIENQTDTFIADAVRAKVTDPIEVTDEDVQAAFDAKVAENESSLATSTYLVEMYSANGTQIYWYPEGYRTVKHVLLKMTDEQSTALSDANTKVTDIEKAITTVKTDMSEEDIAAAETETADKIAEIKAAAEETIATLKAEAEEAAKAAAEAATDAAETATEAATDAAESATEAVSDAAESATEAVADAAESATEAVSDAAEATTEAVSDAAETATETVSDAAESATEAVAETAKEATDAAETTVEEATEALEAAAEDVTETAAEAADTVEENLEEVAAEAGEAAEAVSDAVEEAAEDVADAAEEAAEEAAEDLTALPLSELLVRQAEAETAVDVLKAEIMASLQSRIDEVYAALDSGRTFDDVMAEYGEDPGMQSDPGMTNGYYVTEGSTYWETEFTETAMALEKVGDVSEPVLGSNGAHIIYYNSDVTPGAIDIETVREALSEETLTTKQDEAYDAALAEWKSAAKIKTWPDRIDK